MAEEKVKVVNISLTQTQVEKARELSIKIFGRSNVSGYYAFLIEREYKLINQK